MEVRKVAAGSRAMSDWHARKLAAVVPTHSYSAASDFGPWYADEERMLLDIEYTSSQVSETLRAIGLQHSTQQMLGDWVDALRNLDRIDALEDPIVNA